MTNEDFDRRRPAGGGCGRSLVRIEHGHRAAGHEEGYGETGAIRRRVAERGRGQHGARAGDRRTAGVHGRRERAHVAGALLDGARLLVERRIHRVFVVGGDELAVFSTRDAMEATRVARLGAPIASVMSTRVLAIDRTAQLAQGISLLEDEAVTGVVVTDDGLPIGVFGQAQAIAARDLPADTPIEDHLDHSLLLLPARTPLFRAAAFSQSTSARRIVAVGANHQMVGVVTGLDFCRALAGGPVEPIRGVLPGARA